MANSPTIADGDGVVVAPREKAEEEAQASMKFLARIALAAREEARR